MQIHELALPGVKLIKTKLFFDDRGFFRETYRKPLYVEKGILCDFVQDNHSLSVQGTIRGMHFQRIPGQAKLVHVVHGIIYDVVVDIRKDSPTYKQWLGVTLEADQGDQLFVPVGYAHGFCVLSEIAHVCYKVSTIYDSQEEKSFRFNDPDVRIQWPHPSPILSDRDKNSPFLHEVAL
jgi:dTDP-4-dehydrorhamnose 3,5-epimerase